MFDWHLAIEKNTAALTQIVAGLFVLVGIAPRSVIPDATAIKPAPDLIRGDPLTPSSYEEVSFASQSSPQWIPVSMGTGMTIGRDAYLQVASVLRAAESALRRLIMLYMKVKGIKAGSYKLRKDDCPLPDFASFGTSKNRHPKFDLIDPRKPIVFGWTDEKEDWDQNSLRGRASKCDQHLCQSVNARSADAEQEENRRSPANLLQRLHALDHALKNLPAQAKRMALEIEKRKAIASGTKSVPPIRIGYPPGYRERHVHEVDHILEECHGLVMDWERTPP